MNNTIQIDLDKLATLIHNSNHYFLLKQSNSIDEAQYAKALASFPLPSKEDIRSILIKNYNLKIDK